MIVRELYTAIKTRLQADTGSGGLYLATTPLVTGVFDNYASASQLFPYIVVDFGDAFSDDAFLQNHTEVLVRINVYASKQLADSGNSANILARIYGDSFNSTSFTPSYGLHRWTPSLSGAAWASTGMYWQRDLQLHEEDHYHWVQEYAVRLYQVYTAPTP